MNVREQIPKKPAAAPAARSLTPAPFGTLQRQCACGGSGGECEECKKKRTLQRRPGTGADPATVPSIVYDVLRSPGQPLDRDAREFFAPRFGHDFSKVRVHTDARAAESARAVNALAYTVGGHLVFDSRQYAPGTSEGRKLLAHELTHVFQQRNAPEAPASVLGAVTDPLEREADLAAVKLTSETSGLPQAFAGMARPQTIPAGGSAVQRKATFSAGSVREERNAAEQIINGGPAGATVPMLNGTKIRSSADAEAAVKEPEIQSTPKKKGGVECSIKTVPENVGSFDESVLSTGPWSFQAPKPVVSRRLGLACRGAGDSTVTAHGRPSDADVATANRTHEDHHATDDEQAFNATIGTWDQKMTDAEKNNKVFEGASTTKCEMAIHAAMEGTPKSIAAKYWGYASAAGDAFHRTAGGGNLTASNATWDPACAHVDIDVRQ